MTNSLTRLFICLILTLWPLTDSAPAQPPTREVEVTVTVRDPAQQPLQGVPILFPDIGDRPEIRTDHTGVATGKAMVQVGSSTLHAMVSPGLVGGVEDVRAALRDHVEFLRQWAFSSKYRIALTAEVEKYTLEIVARPAVRVSGRLVDFEGKPVGLTIARARGLASPLPSYAKGAPGEFCVGVPRDEKSEIVLIATEGRGIVTRQVSASEDAVALGDILLPTLDKDSSIKFNWTDVAKSGDGTQGGVGFMQLIAADGSRIIQCMVHLPPQASGQHPDDPLAVPSGDFYVVTGGLSADDDEKILVLRDAARDGRDLAAMGIPRVRLNPQGTSEVNLDSTKLRKVVAEVVDTLKK